MPNYRSPIRNPRDLKMFGPRLAIKLGHPMARIGSHIQSTDPKSSTMPALIDTGAQRTVVTPEAVKKVGLSKINETTLRRVGGLIDKVGVYAASMEFPGSQFTAIEIMEVSCCELPLPSIQCLLGRDVLARWIFTYEGPSGSWNITEETVGTSVEPPEGFDLWGE